MITYLLHSLAWSVAWFFAGYVVAKIEIECRRNNKSGGN